MFDSIQASAQVALWALGNFAVLLGILWVGKVAYARTNHDDLGNSLKDIFTKKGLTALPIAFAGYLVGLGIAASGALLSPGPDAPLEKIALIAGSGIAAIILMRISLFINDKLILGRFSNMREILEDQNIGVAFVEAGGCLATGFMIYAVMTCQSMSLTAKLFDGLIYWAVGQTLLVIGAKLFSKTLPYDVQTELQDNNNAAAGIVYGGFLLSLGLVIMTAISGATSNITDELGTIGVFYLVGMVLLLAIRYLASFVVSSKVMAMTKENKSDIGVAVLELASLLCVAILFVSSLAPANTSSMFADQPVVIKVIEKTEGK